MHLEAYIDGAKNLSEVEVTVTNRCSGVGLVAPSEQTIKHLAAVVCASFWPISIPSATETHAIVGRLKESLRMSPTAIRGMLEYPEFPANLPNSIKAVAYKPGDQPVVRSLGRYSLMLSKVVMRKSNRFLAPAGMAPGSAGSAEANLGATAPLAQLLSLLNLASPPHAMGSPGCNIQYLNQGQRGARGTPAGLRRLSTLGFEGLRQIRGLWCIVNVTNKKCHLPKASAFGTRCMHIGEGIPIMCKVTPYMNNENSSILRARIKGDAGASGEAGVVPPLMLTDKPPAEAGEKRASDAAADKTPKHTATDGTPKRLRHKTAPSSNGEIKEAAGDGGPEATAKDEDPIQ